VKLFKGNYKNILTKICFYNKLILERKGMDFVFV